MNINSNRGQSIVEFALTLPILVLIILVIVEFGLMFNAQLTLNNASREGAREAVFIKGPDQDIEDVVIDYASSTLSNINYSHISVTPASMASRVRGEEIRVTIAYPYTFQFQFIGVLAGTRDPDNVYRRVLNAETAMRIE